MDPPEIKDLIEEGKKSGDSLQKRQLGREIVHRRAEAKKQWRTDLLDRAAAGDYQVISYFRRKQAQSASQLEYCLKVGGVGPAVGSLQSFYKEKYAPTGGPAPLTNPMHLFKTSVGPVMPAPKLITKEEVEQVLLVTKSGKSCGRDGAPYEFWAAVLQSEACEHLLDFLNEILLGNQDFPTNWMLSQIVLLPKTKEPAQPKDYRPIVLAATLSKIFTKALLLRLREFFPPMLSGQLSSQVGAQSLDGSVALKHLVHLSRQWGLPLLACKLDVQAAFDTLSHDAVARFLSSLGPHQESKLLLDMITRSEVSLNFANHSWTQQLRRGVLQGSAFSAEIFARTLDFYVAPLLLLWASTEATWIRGVTGQPLFAIIFADDILLLATSRDQLVRMLNSLQDTLGAIGLLLARHKCQYIRSPDLPKMPVQPNRFSEPIQEVDTFVFLGVLVGFAVTCQMTVAARLRMATNSFYGYLGFLARTRGPPTKRLHLLNSFVTSKWRWLSAAARPLYAVSKQLRRLHTSLLVSMTRLAQDPLQTSSENWSARTRGARMAAQSCGHKPWDSVHLEAFLGYWGHAARLDPSLHRPITVAMQVRDESWMLANPHKMGRWPNAAFWLTLLWRRCRLPDDPPLWELMAQRRERWKDFMGEVFLIKGLIRDKFYPNLHEVDLCHRCLLRTGDRFWLLPQTHPPIDPPYPSSYQVIEGPENCEETACFCVACDGSKKGVKMGEGLL